MKIDDNLLAALIVSASIFQEAPDGKSQKCILCGAVGKLFEIVGTEVFHKKKCLWVWATRHLEEKVFENGEE